MKILYFTELLKFKNKKNCYLTYKTRNKKFIEKGFP